MTTPITTTTQLEAVPVGHVVRSAAGTIAARFDQDRGVVFGDNRPFPWPDLALPATVLWPLPEPTVKPGRDELARVMDPDARDDTVKKSSHPLAVVQWALRRKVTLDHADAVLAILPGKTEAQVRADALRDAAGAVAVDENDSSDWWDSKHRAYTTPAEWLRNRADEEAGK